MTEKKKTECFVIMPISDHDDYPQGHFQHVYSNIIQPSCKAAGYDSTRADQVKETNLIHLDILKMLIDAPIAICDLSTRNPNVLFELGIRQAFDRPVVLIQEKGTPKIFDIAPLRYLEYSKEMKYHEVLKSQEELKEAIQATAKAEGDSGSINSIVKLLALQNPAQIPDIENRDSLALDYLQTEMRDMRRFMEMSMMEGRKGGRKGSIAAVEYERISNELERIVNSKRVSPEARIERLHRLMRDTEELMMTCEERSDHMHYRYLMERIERARNEFL